MSQLRNQQEAEQLYELVTKLLNQHKFPFMIGGSLSVMQQSDVERPMKDLDIFVKTGHYPKILELMRANGFKISIPDERWLARAIKNGNPIDFIFSSPNYLNHVDDTWFEDARDGKFLGQKVKFLGPIEIIWCKAYVQDRTWYEGADINHIILRQGKDLNWKRLLQRMEYHWELLFGLLLNFRFVYPSERGLVPKWLMEELIDRLQNQLKNPIPRDKICRGPLLSRTQYQIDIGKLGFQVIV